MMKERTDNTWRNSETAKRFIEEVVGGIPLETEQLNIMMRIIGHKREAVSSFLDIGCGNGILASVVLNKYPKARGILLDFNDTMLSAAKSKLADYDKSLEFIKSDYGDDPLDKTLSKEIGKLDVIVSRFSIHHQPDKRKQEIYQEIFHLLTPGGIFVNIEHVAPASKATKSIFEDYMIDHLYQYQLKKGGNKSQEKCAQEFHLRHENDTNIIALAEEQCAWLRDIGFINVNCFFKVFDIAIFGGWKKE